MDLKELIMNNIEILDTESDNKETLAEQKLERQYNALKGIYSEIKDVVQEAGYHIALFKTAKHHAKKHRSYEETWEQSDEHVWLLKIEFEGSISLQNTGETESYYAPHTRYAGQHCGGNDPAYIKISWDDTRGVYHIVPNVAYDYNKERNNVDKRTYLELDGTKDMIIERLAVVFANIMRIQRNFNMGLETIGKGVENE
jgi:hypothetical protein